MKLMPLGDYYVWYCEWCDSRNQTLWTRIEKGEVRCGACHHRYPVAVSSHAEIGQTFSRMI